MTGDQRPANPWWDVDRAREPGDLVDFLEATSTREDEPPASLHLLGLVPNQWVLDVGCGLGADARHMARRVGPGGRVLGVDQSAQMVEEARKRSANHQSNLCFQVADAYALPFGVGTFDACWSKRVLMHLENPALVVSELVRVLKHNGRLVLVEPDADAAVLASSDQLLTRRLLRLMSSHVVYEGR
jgi:ubiquinone/menaquinone biosynthesis C-methylase UbiE